MLVPCDPDKTSDNEPCTALARANTAAQPDTDTHHVPKIIARYPGRSRLNKFHMRFGTSDLRCPDCPQKTPETRCSLKTRNRPETCHRRHTTAASQTGTKSCPSRESAR